MTHNVIIQIMLTVEVEVEAPTKAEAEQVAARADLGGTQYLTIGGLSPEVQWCEFDQAPAVVIKDKQFRRCKNLTDLKADPRVRSIEKWSEGFHLTLNKNWRWSVMDEDCQMILERSISEMCDTLQQVEWVGPKGGAA